VVREKQHVLSDCATVSVIKFQARSLMNYFGLFNWIFIIYFVTFKFKVFA